MNSIFHYYSIYFIAKKLGFNENDCKILAYSSTVIDYMPISYLIRDENGKLYYSCKTSPFSFITEGSPRDCLCPFHFVPGDINFDGAKRKDKKQNAYNTTPSSEQSKELLISALKSKNLYRIGIALHSFFDTYAHQNFSGLNEEWNKVESGINKLIPPIGHSQVGFIVDDYFVESWIDSRLFSEIVFNKERYKKAFCQSYKYLAVFANKNPDDFELVFWEFENVFKSVENKIEFNGFSSAKDVFQKDVKGMIGKMLKKPVEDNNALIEILFEEKYGIKPFQSFLWQEEAINEGSLALFSKVKMINSQVNSYIRHSLGGFLSKVKILSNFEFKAKNGFYDSHFYKFSESSREQLELYKDIEKNI